MGTSEEYSPASFSLSIPPTSLPLSFLAAVSPAELHVPLLHGMKTSEEVSFSPSCPASSLFLHSLSPLPPPYTYLSFLDAESECLFSAIPFLHDIHTLKQA